MHVPFVLRFWTDSNQNIDNDAIQQSTQPLYNTELYRNEC